MLRPKRSAGGGVDASGVRAWLIERAERRLASTREACNPEMRPVYDFRPDVKRQERALEELRSGGPVQVQRSDLPRELVKQWPGVRLFTLRGDDGLEPAAYDRVR